jgi:UDP-N-acetylmuramoyl-L-alanyl-D-glutamate--2,6-diaminopimelate ligase
MRVTDILEALPMSTRCSGGDPEVKGIALNSHQVRPGYIFAAVTGSKSDGWEYVNDALKRGAVGVLTERQGGVKASTCQIVVDDVQVAFAAIAAVVNGYPSRDLKVVGITGTNGKTTTAYMTRAALRAAGLEPGLLGTVAYEVGERVIPAARTTPDAATTQSFLKQMVSAGCRSAVMEVSSHALTQGRVREIDFDAAVFTNLTQDHLDYHKTMEAYFEAKAILFRTLRSDANAAINRDDPWGRRLLEEELPCATLSYGLMGDADVTAEDVTINAQGAQFRAKTPWGDHPVKLMLLGRHNVSNALACIAACGALGIDLGTADGALSKLASVRGRLEPIHSDCGFAVYIDYAHTDDALGHALRTVRELTSGRVIVVFGCGGDRDATKRPKMGKIASELADVVIVTSDNPRSEEPAAIIDAIMAGVERSQATVSSVEDRAGAIRAAIDMAEEGDCVLIAGKGHETYQESGYSTIPFDDRKVAMAALSAGSEADAAI